MLALSVDEVIVYILPTGQRIAQDVNRVGMLPSDGGMVSFKSPDGSRRIGPYRVATSHIEFVLDGTEVSGAIGEIELEYADDDAKGYV